MDLPERVACHRPIFGKHGDETLVVHGTALSEMAEKRIEHAWSERGELVVDLAMPVGARITKREWYYQVSRRSAGRHTLGNQ